MSKNYGGGDDSSVKNAVIIKNTKNVSERITAQRNWISRKYPDWILIKQYNFQERGKIFECIEYFPYDNDNVTKITYFDITGLYG